MGKRTLWASNLPKSLVATSLQVSSKFQASKKTPQTMLSCDWLIVGACSMDYGVQSYKVYIKCLSYLHQFHQIQPRELMRLVVCYQLWNIYSLKLTPSLPFVHFWISWPLFLPSIGRNYRENTILWGFTSPLGFWQDFSWNLLLLFCLLIALWPQWPEIFHL